MNKKVDAEIWPVLDEADDGDDGEESKENEEPKISGTGEDRAPPH